MEIGAMTLNSKVYRKNDTYQELARITCKKWIFVNNQTEIQS